MLGNTDIVESDKSDEIALAIAAAAVIPIPTGPDITAAVVNIVVVPTAASVKPAPTTGWLNAVFRVAAELFVEVIVKVWL